MSICCAFSLLFLSPGIGVGEVCAGVVTLLQVFTWEVFSSSCIFDSLASMVCVSIAGNGTTPSNFQLLMQTD